MDGNAKFGKQIICGDPSDISSNGQLLLDLINRKSLVLVNSTDKCKGVIIRIRVKAGRAEISVLMPNSQSSAKLQVQLQAS